MLSVSSYFLQKSRKDLLDLGMRNPLINFKSKAKIEVVDEISEFIFDILVNNLKTMRFLPLPSENSEELDELSKAIDDSTADWRKLFAQAEIEGFADANRHTDNYLQTNLSPVDLHKKLLMLHTGARTYIEEQGVNVLYLALGFLHWFDETAKLFRRAPLVLIPVELKRSDAREKFSLSFNQADIGSNLSLIEKLSVEYHVSIPQISEEEGVSIIDYFNAVSDAIKNKSDWQVIPNEIVLSFFSFGKFVMYEDLDERKWPHDRKPTDHPILNSLINVDRGFSSAILNPDVDIDQMISPGDIMQVIDSDSSQTKAQIDVNNGNNLVIQGPPGTGKSQTITNIIADAVYQGKKVLFVAEKMAALEVVKRRLDAIGLGNAVLELHSHKANKKSLMIEIVRTLNLTRPGAQQNDHNLATLKYAQEKLNTLVKIINTPILQSQLSLSDAVGKLATLRRIFKPDKIINPKFLIDNSKEQFDLLKLIVEDAMGKMLTIGNPSKNVFFGIGLSSLLPSKQENIREILKKTTLSISDLLDKLNSLEILHLNKAFTIHDVKSLLEAFRIYVDRTRTTDQVVLFSCLNEKTKIEEFHALLKEHRTLEDTLKRQIRFEARTDDIVQLLDVARKYCNKWWRYIAGDYRQLKKRIDQIFIDPKKLKSTDFVIYLEAINKYKQTLKQFEEYKDNLEKLLGQNWSKYKTDPLDLQASFEWVRQLKVESEKNGVSRRVDELINVKPDITELNNVLNPVSAAYKTVLNNMQELAIELKYDELNQENMEGESSKWLLSDTLDRLQKWETNIADLKKIVSYNSLKNQLNNDGLGYLIEVIQDWDFAGEKLAGCFEFSYYQGLLDYAYENNRDLEEFDRNSYENLMETYRDLDRRVLENNRAKVALKHWEGIPRSFNDYGQMGVLKREMNKKRRLLPIRQLMAEAGEVIRQIKPVFMMGPLSVASFLPPGLTEFDLVIFDEASQVKPVDAFGSILRGKQVVVIGDTKQLPPTSFFESMSMEGDVEDEYVPVSSDTESILGLFLSKNAPEHMLRWHYRSRHESLIAISNKEFYDDKLVVFPSPGSNISNIGLSFVHIPQALYDKGRTRVNMDEAMAVAKAVMEHIKFNPKLTLGIAAFSSNQRDAIILQLEVLRKTHPEFEFFFNDHPNEPFFVKNLENVQGDERDVILISIGYGRAKQGEPISMNFGPLNKDGGERRLNVLISRARIRCKVFANFTSADMDMSRTSSVGVMALRSFLHYAETGLLERNGYNHKIPHPLVEHIQSKLLDAGFHVETQVGISDYRIDLAVRNSKVPDQFIIGIECDGKNYISARSARDRTRLRKEVLERLGWNLYRIWSIEWYRDERCEFEGLLEAINSSGNNQKTESIVQVAIEENDLRAEQKNEVEGIVNSTKHETHPTSVSNQIIYQAYNKSIPISAIDFHLVNPNRLVEWVNDVVELEGPIHKDILKKRITNGVGLTKVGNRINVNLETAIEITLSKGLISSDGQFYFMKDKPVEPRSRITEDQLVKKLEHIPPMELMAAFFVIIHISISVVDDELINGGFHLLGFQKVTSQMRSVGQSMIERCLKNGKFKRDSLNRIVFA